MNILLRPSHWNLKGILKFFIGLILCGCFFAHVWNQVLKHFEGRTMTAESKLNRKRVVLPSVTLCSPNPYKNQGHFFNRSAFQANTHSYEDFFHPSNRDNMREKDVCLKEINSQVWGRCFTLSSDHEFKAREYINVALQQDNPGILVFVHEREHEFWMTASAFPYEIKTKEIKRQSECALREEIFYNMHYPSRLKYCKDWGWKEFFNCAKQKLKDDIKERNFQCYTHWWKKYFSPSIPECTNKDSQEIERIGKWSQEIDGFPVQFTAHSNKFGCPYPCTNSNVKISCADFNMDNHYSVLDTMEEEDPPQYLRLYAARLWADLEEEIYVYDFIAIVAGVGGSLGFFLGFSCLEALFALLSGLLLGWNKQKMANLSDPSAPPLFINVAPTP